MNLAVKVWDRIVGFGTTPNLNEELVLKIRLLNKVLAIIIVLGLVMLPLFLLVGVPHIQRITITCTVAYSLHFAIIAFRNFNLALHYDAVISYLILIFFAYSQNATSNYYIFIFPIVTIIYYLFSEQRILLWYNLLSFFTLAALLWFGLDLLNTGFTAENITYIYLGVIGLVTEIFILVFFRKQFNGFMTKLQRSQESLKEAQILAEMGAWEYDYESNRFKLSDNTLDIIDLSGSMELTFSEFLKSRMDKSYHRKLLNFKDDMFGDKKISFLYSANVEGELKWYEIKSKKVYRNGILEKLIGTLQDRTERKKNADRLAYSISLLEATIDATNDGVLVVDNDGTIVRYNKQFLELWDVPTKEHRNLSYNFKTISYGIDKLQNPKQFRKKIKDLMDNPSAVSYERLVMKNGKVLEGSSQPQYLGDKIMGRVWTFHDITDTENTKAALRASNEELQRSNNELKHFAYLSSHDLQEPLRMVGNFVELLEIEYGDRLDDEGRMYIDYAVSSVKRMSKSIEDLLEYSKVGRHQKNKKKVDVTALLNVKILDLASMIKRKKAEIIIENLPKEIYCIPNQIGTVFYNLIKNGLKFNKNDKPKIMITSKEMPDSWQFSISDNGIGIAERNHETIFEIFKRLHRKEDYKGTGMGLSFCKRIIENHDGTIWVTSTLGEGSTFHFTIPKT